MSLQGVQSRVRSRPLSLRGVRIDDEAIPLYHAGIASPAERLRDRNDKLLPYEYRCFSRNIGKR